VVDSAHGDAPRDNLTRSVPFTIERDDDEAGDGFTLQGHGAVFNEWTEIDSWEGRFKERIVRGAFRKTLQENGHRVRLQFDHGHHPLIGSLPIGAIRKLKEDATGLFVEARLADNWLVQPVREAIANGSIDGMSFRFSVVGEKWDHVDSDLPERTITEVRLMEVGPVVWPAYPTTDVGVRSVELARSLMNADDTTRREIAAILIRESGDSDTETNEAADGTSIVEAVTVDDDAAASTSLPYPHVQRAAVSLDRLRQDRDRVNARVAAVSARSAT
jgi:hypothetical protein